MGVRGPCKEMKCPIVNFCNTNVIYDLTNLHYRTNFSTNLSGQYLGNEPQSAHPTVNTYQLLPTLMVPSSASKIDKLKVRLDTGSTSSFITAQALKGVRHETLDNDVILSINTLHGTAVQQSWKVRCHVKTSFGNITFDYL